MAICVQYGCGLSAAAGWQNYDASPTLYLQRLPVLGSAFRILLAPQFPAEVKFGDVVKRLPHEADSVDFVYCSHVLEHLSLNDLRAALKETFRVMRGGGIFRGVLPDLEVEIQRYLQSQSDNACSDFMAATLLGQARRTTSPLALIRDWLGNSRHLWMWDFKGLSAELTRAGFSSIRRARYADSSHPVFAGIEARDRWEDCLGFECRK